MAGEPKPCVMKEKWERQLWMPGSRMGVGLELPRGVLSWASRSVNSLHSCLQVKTHSVMSDYRVSLNHNKWIFSHFNDLNMNDYFITTNIWGVAKYTRH